MDPPGRGKPTHQRLERSSLSRLSGTNTGLLRCLGCRPALASSRIETRAGGTHAMARPVLAIGIAMIGVEGKSDGGNRAIGVTSDSSALRTLQLDTNSGDVMV